MPSQQVLQKKISEVEEVAQLIKNYKVIGMASLKKVRAAQLQEFKKKLTDKVFMRVIQNTLMKRAIEICNEKPELKKLIEYLEGSNIYLFTDLNPFKLALLLEKGKVITTAKSGDTAALDVVVPVGNTAQPPGPIISQLNAVGLPTRIESGSVWITKDTLVAEKGEIISERLATILSKLGIKSVEAGLAMKVAYDENMIIAEDQLQIDLGKIRRNIENAHEDAFRFSLSIAYPTTENTEMLVRIAYQEAYTLAINAAISTKETIRDIIRKAHAEMSSLSNCLQNTKK